ncbi:GNAT family N-acetyltransferase [Streptomyces sp. SID4985]|uniref:GNAT family N-acetyltransferase n=1 Tax=unclassified Streptomyces TaxID=2593676 RepID=UPI001371A151|nr:GNAT family N-acetyltransferase [Streptomyces sp. SID4985]MYQ48343.1 GNAT family N-acetyltransferase [Streptomyces sp. SID4985]
MTITMREGGPADVPLVLGMFDSAVAWLAAQGRTGQWGSSPWSEDPAAVAKIEKYVAHGVLWIAEADGEPAAALVLADSPAHYVAPADEPERYIQILTSDRRFKGHGAGAALIAHAVEETRRAGVSLLRVDCYAGDDGKLVAFYEKNGFAPAESLSVGEKEWPGLVLTRRV